MIGFRWTIRLRLAVGFGLTILALLVAGVVGIQSLGSLERDVRRSVGQVAEVGHLLFLTHDATLRLVALSQAELMGTERFQAAAMDSLSALADSLRWVLVTASPLSTEERQRLEQIGTLQGRIEVRLAVARAYRDVGRIDDAFRQAGVATRTLDSLFAQSAAINLQQERRAAATLDRVGTVVADRRFVLAGLLVAGVVLGLLFGRLTWQAITGPVDWLVGAARTLGSGDLRVTVSTEGLDEEYRELASAFSETADALRRVVAEIQREAEAVAQAAISLNTASEQAADSTGQISTVVAEIARESESQRQHLATSETVLAEVGEAAETVGSTARRSREVGSEIREIAHQTRSGIAQALDSLGRAERVIRSSADAVKRLETASQAVEKFVSAIVTVADQTDLLSLNAAIEAARAGEHGRGFAVVADEVRKLAGDSSRAAEEVRGVVDKMHSQVAEAVSAFKRGVAGLGDVGTVSRTADEALAAIDKAVGRVEELAASVAQAAEASGKAVRALVTRLTEVGAQAETQASASEEAAAAAQETAATAQEVSATAHTLQESAERLNQMISRFRV